MRDYRCAMMSMLHHMVGDLPMVNCVIVRPVLRSSQALVTVKCGRPIGVTNFLGTYVTRRHPTRRSAAPVGGKRIHISARQQK